MPRPSLSCIALLFVSLVAGCGTPFSARDHITLTAPRPASMLVVDNGVGDIVIRAGDSGGEVRAEVVRVGKGASIGQAEEALQDIKVALEAKSGEAGTLLARAEHPAHALGKNYEAQWTIVAPPDVPLTIENSVGDIKVDGFWGPVSIRNSVGDTTVIGGQASADSTGPTTIKVGVGDVRASRSSGGLEAETEVGDIHAEADGPIRLLSDVGDVHLSLRRPTSQSISINSRVGDVIVYLPTEQRGRLTADTGVGSVEARLGDMNLSGFRQRNHSMSADLGASTTPTIDLTAGVGDVMIQSHPFKAKK